MLELIARTVSVVGKVDADFLLQNLSEEYWRVRVLQALLCHRPQPAVKLAADYPKEFIWAVGRAKADSYLPLLGKLAKLNKRKIDMLSIYARALGQLGAER